MSKRIKAKKKRSRSLGVNLWGRSNSPYIKRNTRPGQHGANPRRITNHSIHLLEKQKIRDFYYIVEKQFRNLFLEAKRLPGNTEDDLAGLLESRLATIVYRSNIAPTIYSARQLVSHKHILVNGKPISISSYIVSPNDVISVAPKAKKIPLIVESLQNMEKDVPPYLELNAEDMSVKFLNRPKAEDVVFPFEASFSMVVEYYSK